MTDVPTYLSSIRYMANEMITQLDNVHKSCCTKELDIETVMLNLADLKSQMDDISAELQDMRDELQTVLEGEDGDGCD